MWTTPPPLYVSFLCSLKPVQTYGSGLFPKEKSEKQEHANLLVSVDGIFSYSFSCEGT
jgi:hypothetical protein